MSIHDSNYVVYDLISRDVTQSIVSLDETGVFIFVEYFNDIFFRAGKLI